MKKKEYELNKKYAEQHNIKDGKNAKSIAKNFTEELSRSRKLLREEMDSQQSEILKRIQDRKNRSTSAPRKRNHENPSTPKFDENKKKLILKIKKMKKKKKK